MDSLIFLNFPIFIDLCEILNSWNCWTCFSFYEDVAQYGCLAYTITWHIRLCFGNKILINASGSCRQMHLYKNKLQQDWIKWCEDIHCRRNIFPSWRFKRQNVCSLNLAKFKACESIGILDETCLVQGLQEGDCFLDHKGFHRPQRFPFKV